MEVLTDENNTLHSTIKLLNVRLSAILEIVSIQEAELTRNGGGEGLLRTWREKVFALMVHLQSQAIVQKEMKRKEDAKVRVLMVFLCGFYFVICLPNKFANFMQTHMKL